MPRPNRGEVWLVDLGYAGKIRPCLVLSVAPAVEDRALVTAVAHTTSRRGSRFEVEIDAPFLEEGAFDAQNLATVAQAKYIRRLGTLDADSFRAVEAAVRSWLGIDDGRD